MLFIRSGFVSTYHSKPEDERVAAALRPHALGKDDGQRWAGIKQEDEMIDFLHDCYFSAVAGDAPALEAWPSQEGITPLVSLTATKFVFGRYMTDL